jgi:hypothetical protein
MAMKVRRIVTGHNVAGKAVVKTDEQITDCFTCSSVIRRIPPEGSRASPGRVAPFQSASVPARFDAVEKDQCPPKIPDRMTEAPAATGGTGGES